MKFSFLLLIFLLGPNLWAHEIKVRVATSSGVAHLSAKRLKLLNYNFDNIKIKIFKKKNSWKVVFQNKELNLNFPLAPLVLKGSGFRLLDQKQKKLPKEFVLYDGPGKQIDMVADLDIQSYLKGVLPKEMSPSWPLEALKAQAILARSFALGRQRSDRHESFDVDATALDQVFEYNKNPSTRISKAVEITKNQILVNPKGMAFTPYYHAHCGGQTDKTEFVWGEKEFGASVKDKYCAKKSLRWNYNLSFSQLEKKLKIKNIKSVKLVNLSDTKRVKEVLVVTKQNSNLKKYKFSVQKLRSIFGYNKFKSAMFEVEIENDGIVFKGNGHGHGVGLCQWGSKEMAHQGFSASEILSYYYPGSQIKTITDFKLLGAR